MIALAWILIVTRSIVSLINLIGMFTNGEISERIGSFMGAFESIITIYLLVYGIILR